jgi:hypothetical protein
MRKAAEFLARNKIIVGTTVVFLFLTTIFLPEVAAAGWHLFHGNSAKYLVWEVPVPWGWREHEGNNFILIQKIGVWSNSHYDVIVSALDEPGITAIDDERWKRARIETELKDGHQFVSKSQFQLDGEAGFCLTFAGNENADLLWIGCRFPIHRLSIGYVGTKDHSQILNLIIPKIRASR